MENESIYRAIRELCRAIENLTFEIDRLRRENEDSTKEVINKTFDLRPTAMIAEALNRCNGKTDAIKTVRDFTGSTLYEAKDFVEKFTRHNLYVTENED